MTPEQETQFNQMREEIRTLRSELDFRSGKGIGAMSDAERIKNGLGFFGRTTDTTATGSILVYSPEGPIKIITGAA